ncbi:MAG: hypothetical protein AB7D28_04645 [Candidatus Berkiella sp.]
MIGLPNESSLIVPSTKLNIENEYTNITFHRPRTTAQQSQLAQQKP